MSPGRADRVRCGVGAAVAASTLLLRFGVAAAVPSPEPPPVTTEPPTEQDAAGVDGDESEDPTLELFAGVGRKFRPGGSTLVSVHASSETTIDGRVVISVISNDAVAVTAEAVTDLHLQARTTKRLDFVLPVPDHRVLTIRADLYVGDERKDRQETTLESDPGGELVAVLPSLHDAPGAPSAPTAPDGDAAAPAEAALQDETAPNQIQMPVGGTARVISLEPNRWRVAPWEAYGTIVATAADLEAIDPTWLPSLVRWLNHGGRLLVDDDAGTSLPGLPEEWSAARWTDVGLGEITFSGGHVRRGGLGDLLLPSAVLTTVDPALMAVPLPTSDVAADLPYDAVVSKVPVLVLAISLGTYCVVVSPFLFFGLSRTRRRGLAWMVVPLLAAGLAGATLSRGEQATPGAAHMSHLETGPTGSHVTTYLGSVAGDRFVAELPEAWTQTDRPTAASAAWRDGGGQPERIDAPQRQMTDDGEELLRSRPDGNGFGAAAAEGPDADQGALIVEVTSAETERLAGTVTNETGLDLTDVIVFTGTTFVEVADLRAGERVDWTLEDIHAGDDLGLGPDRLHWGTEADRAAVEAAENGNFMRGPGGGMLVIDDMGGMGGGDGFDPSASSAPEASEPPDPHATVRSSLWSTVRGRDLAMIDTTAVVGAAGWTRDYTPPISPDAQVSSYAGRSVVTGYSAGNSLRQSFGWRLLRGNWNGLLFEFRLPPDLSPEEAANLVIVVPQLSVVSMFKGTPDWGWHETALLDLPGGEQAHGVRVPPEAIVQGRVLANLWATPQDVGEVRMMEIS